MHTYPADPTAANAESWFVRRTGATPAASAPLSDLLKLLGVACGPAGVDGGPHMPVWRVRAGELLVQEGSDCDAVHVVRSGSFKCFKTSEDGYEQVLWFAAAGEVIGFEARLANGHIVKTR